MSGTPDRRPPVAIGHVVLAVRDVPRSKAFLLRLGFRDVEPHSSIGVLELRGGTHVLVLPRAEPVAPGTPAPFDLMVDDLERTREAWLRLGLEPSEIRTDPYHRSFTIREPGGHELQVQSSHASGEPV
jgi:hypothetical protein